MSFVVDEKIPVSRWQEAGYASPTVAALDWSNTQPAHWICNARKGDGKAKGKGKPTSVLPLPQPWEL